MGERFFSLYLGKNLGNLYRLITNQGETKLYKLIRKHIIFTSHKQTIESIKDKIPFHIN